MYNWRTTVFCAVAAILGSILSLRATAQFEVAPDHFSGDRGNAAQSASSGRFAREIAAIQQELDGYYAAIQGQAETVNSAHEVAAGAGALGDGAWPFIDEYVRQKRELDRLKSELAPRIVLAQLQIEALKHKQARLAEAGSPVHLSSPNPQLARRSQYQQPALLASVSKARK